MPDTENVMLGKLIINIFCHAVFIVTCLKLMEAHRFIAQGPFGMLRDMLLEALSHVLDLYMVLSLYFGKYPSQLALKCKKIPKVFLFLIVFGSTIVFMSYKASLTAELALKRSSLPFQTMEEVINSNYRCLDQFK